MNLYHYILSLCKNSRGLFIERIKQPSIIICKKKSQVHTAFPIRTLRIRLSSFEWIKHHACHNHNLHYARGVCATNIKYTRWYVEIDIHILMKNRYIRKTWAEIILNLGFYFNGTFLQLKCFRMRTIVSLYSWYALCIMYTK